MNSSRENESSHDPVTQNDVHAAATRGDELIEGSASRDETNCTSVVPLLHRYVEGEIDPIRSRRIAEHLASCRSCADRKEQLDVERLWLVESLLDSPALSERFAGKVRSAIESESAPAARTEFERVGARIGRGGSAWIAAAAAAVIAAAGVWTFSSRPEWWNESPIVASAPDDATARAAVSSALETEPPRSAKGLVEERIPTDLAMVDEGTVLASRSSTARTEPAVTLASLSTTRPDELPSDMFLCRRPGSDGPSTQPVSCRLGPPLAVSLPLDAATDTDCEAIHTYSSTPRVRAILLHGTRRAHVYVVRIKPSAAVEQQLRVGYFLASRLLRSEADPGESTVRPTEDAPCPTDPNSDGKLDVEDVAYMLQVAHGAATPGAPAEEEPGDSGCAASCLEV